MLTKISHRFPIRVRYADTDKMGVVNNGRYFLYFEAGRSELMRNWQMPYPELESAGYVLPLIEAHANYHGTAEYDDLIEVEATLDLELKPTLKFDYVIFKNDRPIVQGHTIHSFVKFPDMQPVKPPAIFREGIKKIIRKLNQDAQNQGNTND